MHFPPLPHDCNNMPFSVVVIIFSIVALGNASAIRSTARVLPTRIQPSKCIANETHCHCVRSKIRLGETCVMPVPGVPGKCYEGRCLERYKCDCESDDICMKESIAVYQRSGDYDSEAGEFDCKQAFKKLPKSITGRTTSLHVVSAFMYALFRNNEQVSYGLSGEYDVATVEIKRGDIIAVIARRKSKDEHGIKLRFRDLQNEIRTIDKNWRCSHNFSANWLDHKFNAEHANWAAPSMTTKMKGDSFDSNLPWMWLTSSNADSDLIFCRYMLP